MRRAIVLAAGALLASCGGAPPPGGADAGAKTASPEARSASGAAAAPNIVVILTDDQDTAFEHMNQLRGRVAHQGVVFDNSFVSVPMCCPSRATLFTGLYAHNHGVYLNAGALGGFERFKDLGLESSTIATWLKTAGYRTGLIGKYLNRYPGDRPGADRSHRPPGWDTWAAFFMADHTLPFWDYMVNDNGDAAFYPRGGGDYSTDDMTRRALKFLDAAEQNDAQPFFLFIAPSAPHLPADPAPRHKGMFSGYTVPQSGAFNEDDMSDKPRYYQALPLLTARDIKKMDEVYQARLESLQSVDEMIYEILERLERHGETGNTYIFFTSDNGFMLGQHRFPRGKDAPYEESIRVPLIVRGPGVAAGQHRPHMVVNVDLTATIVALAGARPDRTLEGRSLVPLLGGTPPPESAWRRDFIIEHWRDDGDADGIPAYFGVRSTAFKYLEYETGELELYSMEVDAHENHNIAYRGDQAPVVQQLKARLAQLKECRGDGC